GVVEYVTHGIQTIATFAPIPITGWTVVNSVQTQNLYDSARFTRNVIVSIGLVSLILASLFFFLFARSLTRPLIDLVSTAEQIAEGDLTVNITSENRRDEIGTLAQAFTGMIRSLKKKEQIAQKIAEGDLTAETTLFSEKDTLGNAFSTMITKLRQQTQEIVEGVTVIASSGSEIMASVSQLTSSAAETATAVSQTTATVEEVKQTTDVSSQKAKHVSELGKKSVEISQTGLKSIEDTIQGMDHIKEQMESIADMVVQLSEQNQAIGEIIATVNDLAEQSNLLAVNASIEAAKAGEQGKGFAVVAQEIRSLASQSKQATTQVRTILFEVQKAISSAVMATELGSKAVQKGVGLSQQGGEAIDVLAQSVVEATNASIQIAASSQEQMIGMDQIVSAMENIREAALQMASSTKQTEKSVHDLHDLGLKLQDIVKRYKM
nr:methyl-accepting chemotaxis protein [Syntrophales bacterium]